ncbi:MAG TPA: lytic murein transglycosylase [Bdellovibrionota bacterium]|jgi:membrane-bound lytic murein transglycosylase B
MFDLRAKFLFPILLLAACAANPAFRVPSSMGPNEYAAQKLVAKGIHKEFLDLILKTYRDDQRHQVLELNLLGFLRANQATGNEQIPGWELQRVKKFLENHKKTFKEAERQFRVPKEVIASLLWVETKHGRDVGTFHVSSALFSLAQADYPTLLDELLDSARKKAAEYDKVVEARIQERSHSKSDWAVGELIALQEIHERGWKNVEKLHGSFSGAFGMAQFVPSSYLTWAKSKRAKPNLFQAEDSILSVANYLNSNGWKRRDTQAQMDALFHYNRDKAYVTHILKMSKCLRSPPPSRTKKAKRATASAKAC